MKFLKLTAVFVLLFLFHSCEQPDQQVEPIAEPDFISTHFNPSENPEVLDLLSSTLQSTSINGRAMASNVGDINLEDAIQIDHLANGITRYTFRIATEEPDVLFKNLIIRVPESGDVSGYTISYVSRSGWVPPNDDDIMLTNFTGEVVFRTLSGSPFYMIDMIEGSGEVYVWEWTEDENGRIECEGSGGSGGGGGTSSGGWASSGGRGGFLNDIPISTAPSGSELTQDEAIKVEMPVPEGGHLLARTECDSTAPDHGNGDGDAEPIGVLPDLERRCPVGQEMINGECQPVCPQNHRRIADGTCVPIEPCQTDDEIINAIQDALKDIWENSNANHTSVPMSERREDGGWVVDNNGILDYQPFPESWERTSCGINPPTDWETDIPSNTIGWVHSHPFFLGEDRRSICGYNSSEENYIGGPSRQDYIFLNALQNVTGNFNSLAYVIDGNIISSVNFLRQTKTFNRCGF